MKISPKDAEVLAHGYDSGFWKVFRRVFLEQRQMEIAQATPFQREMDMVVESRGRIVELLNIEKDMKAINKKLAKQEEV